ncbi:MAG: lyase family protein [Patescibacteria group bacterium]|nr:lyase family protein [Patescibacteria group bacterium]
MKQSNLYGEQTRMAVNNFPYPVHPVRRELIYAIAEVKKAAAIANLRAGNLDESRAQAIAKAADEVSAGMHDEQFITPSIQGGAGTSMHMNVNEVLAARAEQILRRKGISVKVHPNDHVNMSQSTNDVNPSALRIATIRLGCDLIATIGQLTAALRKKADEFAGVKKLARTHMQDAVPTTLGAEFRSYADIVARNQRRIEEALAYLYELNLGGTAIGNSINASEAYREHVYYELQKIVKIPVCPAENMMPGTSSGQDFCHLSATLTIMSTDLSKISTDIRFLSSGPRGGIGEIRLKALQPGSSIMPGKVNPVIPESMNQIHYYISGKNLTIHQAAEGAHLELGIMFPVIADSILSQLTVLNAGIAAFTENCILPMEADTQRCSKLLEESSAYATLLTPELGYDTVSRVVKKAIETKKTIRETLVEDGLIDQDRFDRIVSIL